jgi:hypothetical protein
MSGVSAAPSAVLAQQVSPQTADASPASNEVAEPANAHLFNRDMRANASEVRRSLVRAMDMSLETIVAPLMAAQRQAPDAAALTQEYGEKPSGTIKLCMVRALIKEKQQQQQKEYRKTLMKHGSTEHAITSMVKVRIR